MKSSLLLALLMLAPTEVVVRDGESLAQVAQRTLGDRGGASELKALNGLKDDAVAPGTKLKLPGPDREHAQRSLTTARNALAQADKAARREEAAAKLKEAESYFQGARYEDAAQAADGAWKLVSTSPPPQPGGFSVAVDDKGNTTVESKSGPPVRVEAEGVTRPVYAGESVRVEKGQPPPPPRAPLGVPQLTQPPHKQKLTVQPAKGGPSPVTLSWKPVEGAEGYEVELVSVRGEKRQLPANTHQLKVPLSAGAWRWSVRAVTREARSEASAEQSFEVAEAQAKPINLHVKPTNWK
ncbi:LysM peptidoglycan-binding domain-containing protein [Archangium lansingense]|uniref:LysM peptidoglycan-binding domain-containing protein n=1 Tax=Archangium lansingense TaxID=2995310 RepID=A0ABT4AGS2_9BACT|nr:LysM peptidoglycan-binding domain-containing protein [Archangium lansinium]MCY1080786.1 LysM peptidoglycan-binding domain-containing protein [Archangium lansinium]